MLALTSSRRRLREGKRFLFLTPRALALAEGYFARYGLWTIFFARFVTGLRVSLASKAKGLAQVVLPQPAIPVGESMFIPDRLVKQEAGT